MITLCEHYAVCVVDSSFLKYMIIYIKNVECKSIFNQILVDIYSLIVIESLKISCQRHCMFEGLEIVQGREHL